MRRRRSHADWRRLHAQLEAPGAGQAETHDQRHGLEFLDDTQGPAVRAPKTAGGSFVDKHDARLGESRRQNSSVIAP
jgi:hypothetical protein